MRLLLRILLGGGLLALAFIASRALEHGGEVGLFNASAFALVIIGPLGVALVAYERSEIVRHVRAVITALGDANEAGRRASAAAFVAMAQAKKGGRLQEIAAVADAGSTSREVRAAALLIVKRYDRAALREALLAQASSEVNGLKRGEDFFLTLARAAPAFGLIGTILGFIDLLRQLSDASKLGPGMALALTATLYGIATSYCVYHPLAKALSAQARLRAGAWREAEQAALLVHDERGAQDVQAIWERAA
ncbi:MAG: MotA/TolQ/ExbB proton channel family protein [Deltaproteobacteria bacterium]|nr:MotA/TolQ/ExbB proton channel family protein [Deltaproteobacteria bacterium]